MGKLGTKVKVEEAPVSDERGELERNIAIMTDKLEKTVVKRDKCNFDIEAFTMAIEMMEEELNGLE